MELLDWTKVMKGGNQTISSIATFKPTPVKPLIVSSEEFVKDFTPPDYLVDGVMQRGFLYTFTAATGAGKTAIALLLASHIALGRPLGNVAVEKGRVLYLAGENPDDLRMRWLGMSGHTNFDPNNIDVSFAPGQIKISEVLDTVKGEVKKSGSVALVIVDTSAAYFEGDDENDNVDAGKHARMIRLLTGLEGNPTVLLLAHPAKNATDSNLLPRGGGALIAEVDGNYVAKKDGQLVEMSSHGKFRGVDFKPLVFELRSVRARKLKDSKGRPIPTVIAVPLSDEELASQHFSQEQAGDRLLSEMARKPGSSFADLAKALGGTKKQIQTLMDKLRNARLVEMDKVSNRYKLTKLGERHIGATQAKIGQGEVSQAVPSIR